MKKFNFVLILLLLNSCGGVENAAKVLRNEKIETTDEFLIKKQEPLILPPDYNNIPKPGSLSKKKVDESDKIKKILKSSDNKKIKKRENSSVEESIINRIRK